MLKAILKSKPGKQIIQFLDTGLMIGVFLGILVIANLIIAKIPWTYDMTVTKIYTLSDQTQKVLAGLKQKITVVLFAPEGKTDRMIRTLLEEYQKAGHGMIELMTIDAEKNPALAKKYDQNNQGIANGNIVFECDGKVKKINPFELVTPSEYGSVFNGEQYFTGAIISLTALKFQKVYFLEGHRELGMSENFSKFTGRIESEAHIALPLNLLKTNEMPDDAEVIVVAAPKRDLTQTELMALYHFFKKGGRGIFLFDILSAETHLPNFAHLLRDYGISIRNNFVVEEDSESFYANNKLQLVPEYASHNIVTKLKSENLYVFLPYAGNIQILKDRDASVMIEPLLQSTSKSWIRYQVKDTRPNQTALDQSGPANLAVAVTKDNGELKYRETKLVIVYNAKFAMDEMLDIQGNYDFMMNALSWVEDKPDSLALRPKMLDTNRMYVKGPQYVLLMMIAVLLIPSFAFGAGLVVWLRRRHL